MDTPTIILLAALMEHVQYPQNQQTVHCMGRLWEEYYLAIFKKINDYENRKNHYREFKM